MVVSQERRARQRNAIKSLCSFQTTQDVEKKVSPHAKCDCEREEQCLALLRMNLFWPVSPASQDKAPPGDETRCFAPEPGTLGKFDNAGSISKGAGEIISSLSV